MVRKNIRKVWIYTEKYVYSSKCKICIAVLNNKSSTSRLWNLYNQSHRLENVLKIVGTESSQRKY